MNAAINIVGIAGTGLIGAGWAARLLIRGFNVIAYDVSPAAEPKLKAAIDVAWPSMRKLLPGPRRTRQAHLHHRPAADGRTGGFHP
jgi:3-hydroxyacyl-CoA dehydrogenase